MSQVDCVQLSSRRARFARLRDSRIFWGWISHHAGSEIVVSGKGYEVLQPGDEVYFEVSTDQGVAIFQATLSLRVVGSERKAKPGETQGLFRITEKPSFNNLAEEPRLSVTGYSVLVQSTTGTTKGQLHDVSRHGLGAFVDAEIASGEPVTVTVSTTKELARLEGTVRYCRQVDDGSGSYRIGIQLETRDRIQSHRWLRLLDDAA